ncbi:MAG: AraC family transcriptional regulator [Bacteroidota bacterium]
MAPYRINRNSVVAGPFLNPMLYLATRANQGDKIRIGQMYLNKDEVDELDRRLNELLRGEKPFLKHNYTLRQLAEDINISLHHLSAFINVHYGMNFNDFINRYRVNYCISIITQEQLKYKKFEAIAKESGFSNRNTFRIAFKKATGSTPSQYLKEKK